MGMTRMIADWIDNKMDEAYDEPNTRKGMAKAALAGAVDGYVYAAAIAYIPVLIACYVYKAKLDKKA